MRRQLVICALVSGILLSGTGPVQAEAASPTAREKLTVKLINQARAEARHCGGKRYPAVGRVTISKQLTYAARRHAADMGKKGYFAHESRNGSDPGERISAANYPWASYGENIAAGQPTPQAVVQAWLESPGHCRIIMAEQFRNVGLGYVKVGGSAYGTYWVADFGTRQ